jgi:hypothetical protein
MNGGLVPGLGSSAIRGRYLNNIFGGFSFGSSKYSNVIQLSQRVGTTIPTLTFSNVNVLFNTGTAGISALRIDGMNTCYIESSLGIGGSGGWGAISFSGITNKTCFKVSTGGFSGTFSTEIAGDGIADTVCLRNTTNPQTFRVYRTTDGRTDTGSPIFASANFERLELTWSGTDAVVGTASGGTGTNRGLILRTAATDRITIAANGQITIADALNINTGTTTGSQLGTTSSQKLGFWGATPVVRPAALVDVTGGAVIDSDCRATLNNLLARLRTIGIITP